jgi:hypothetical protein
MRAHDGGKAKSIHSDSGAFDFHQFSTEDYIYARGYYVSQTRSPLGRLTGETIYFSLWDMSVQNMSATNKI